MKRNKYRDRVWGIAILCFVISVIEGFLYYEGRTGKAISILMILHNAIKSYTSDPTIKIEEAFQYAMNGEMPLIYPIVAYLYAGSVILAPLCMIAAVAVLFKAPVAFLRGTANSDKNESIALFGNGHIAEDFINSLPCKDCKLYAVLNEQPSKEKSLEYISKGIKTYIHYEDLSLEDMFKKTKVLKKKYVLFCDEDSVVNYDSFIKFEHFLEKSLGKSGKKDNADEGRKITVYLHCDDIDLSERIAADYNPGKYKGIYVELVLLDVKDNAVKRMFRDHPIYTVNETLIGKENAKPYDVHMAIVGFGGFGRRALRQAMNLSVLSWDSTIVFDVFDKDMDTAIEPFLKYLNVAILDKLERGASRDEPAYSITLSKDTSDEAVFSCDGVMKLRFWNHDVDTLSFARAFDRCSEESPFTYVVVSTDGCNRLSNILTRLSNKLTDVGAPTVIAKTKSDNEAFDIILKGNIPVGILKENKDIFSFEAMKDEQIVRLAKKFNYLYECFAAALNSEGEGTLLEKAAPAMAKADDEGICESYWKEKTMYDREAAIGQTLHASTKPWIVKTQAPDDDMKARIEHRRWNYFMISHGYCYKSIVTSGEKKDIKRKTHSCITDFDRLKEERPSTIPYDLIAYYVDME